jgi:hypothetical protein
LVTATLQGGNGELVDADADPTVGRLDVLQVYMPQQLESTR